MMFDPQQGGGGGGDPYDQHPLIVAMRAQVQRFNEQIEVADRVIRAMNKHTRLYTFLTIINCIVFGLMAGTVFSLNWMIK